MPRASVIGSGPNGLAAAIVLAQAGLDVEVFEAEAVPGGAARTLELTLPGFRHDFGSAVHPLGAGSPFFSKLPLSDFGLEWIHSPAVLAHPLDDGTAVVLWKDLPQAIGELGSDGPEWSKLLRPFVERWREFLDDALAPPVSMPRHPLLMARFGALALSSARSVANRFRNQRVRALFAGMAGHSFLSLDEAMSGAFAVLLAVMAHAVAWPIPQGGSQSLTNALCAHLERLGGHVRTSSRVVSLDTLPKSDLYLCDITPRQLLRVAGNHLSWFYKQSLQRYPYGPGAFKVDYALSSPVPWKANDCRLAATVHLGGSFDEIAASELAARHGEHAQRPFVLFVQPSLFDDSRAPEGKHTAWAYCHVPNGSQTDMLERIENQIERFAPGFRDCVLARRVLSPDALESMDANLVGGDINGGVLDLQHFLFRPTFRYYGTSAEKIFICSASTPPGGGVHGMCGFHAASAALKRLRK